MPIGIITNVLAILFGGIVGALGGELMSDNFKDGLNMTFSICSIAMGLFGLRSIAGVDAGTQTALRSIRIGA